MVAMRLPPQLIGSSAGGAVQCGLIYKRLFPLGVLAIGQHLSPPLWPGSNINSRAMVNDKKHTGWAQQRFDLIQQTLTGVNQVQSPMVLQPLRCYSPMKCVHICVYVYISVHTCLCMYIYVCVSRARQTEKY